MGDADVKGGEGGGAAFRADVRAVLEELERTLVAKNRAYGDSALRPVRVFSRSDKLEQIRVRIDDKISRLARRGVEKDSEDTVGDLLGYLVLYRIAQRRQRAKEGDHVARGYSVSLADNMPTGGES